MKNDKLMEDIIESVLKDETYSNMSAKLSEEERKQVEASVNGIASIIVPILRIVNDIETDPETITIIRDILSKKMVDG
jgi:hypothetical protein